MFLLTALSGLFWVALSFLHLSDLHTFALFNIVAVLLLILAKLEQSL